MSEITVSHVLSSRVAIVTRRMMSKSFGALLRALDEHLKAGEDISRGRQPVGAAWVRAAALVTIIALASPASAGETTWSQTAAEWIDHYELAVGRYTRADFTSAQAKRGAGCKAQGNSMVTCLKKGSFFYDSASFGSEGRAHYFSLTLTSKESRKPCAEIGGRLKAKYGAPSYGITGGGVGYNFPKKRRHIEFGPTRGVTGCILSIQAGVRTK